MTRYSNTPITTRYDRKRVYLTTTYPTIYPAPSDITVVANENDYLDTLAHKYYGDSTLWWIIASANNIGKGRLSVESGLLLRIPTNINEILDQFNRSNTQE